MVLPGLLYRRRKEAVTGLIIRCRSFTVYRVHRVVYCAPHTLVKGKKGTKHTRKHLNSIYVFFVLFLFYAFS